MNCADASQLAKSSHIVGITSAECKQLIKREGFVKPADYAAPKSQHIAMRNTMRKKSVELHINLRRAFPEPRILN